MFKNLQDEIKYFLECQLPDIFFIGFIIILFILVLGSALNIMINGTVFEHILRDCNCYK